MHLHIAGAGPVVSGHSGHQDQLQEAKRLLDNAVRAALERGVSKDFELVNRSCLEDMGATSLATRRAWSRSGAFSHVNPTPGRLPGMVGTDASISRDWLLDESPLASWNESLQGAYENVWTKGIDDPALGPHLVAVVGWCADMAAWIRTTLKVGD